MSVIAEQIAKAVRSLRWLPAYGWQQMTRRHRRDEPFYVIIAIANHFEPEIMPGESGRFADYVEQEQRVRTWCQAYPKMADRWRDTDGYPLRHTYFCSAEHYDKTLINVLSDHCKEGWGEIEIHLHHGIEGPDTSERTRELLIRFRDVLATHGCLSRLDGQGSPHFAFVHGNWALANSAGGRFCGVDDEMQILRETGCFADLTLPSAPDPTQIGKINSLYECALPLDQPAPHRKGRNLRYGCRPNVFPLIIQGPLGLNFDRRIGRWPIPHIENGALTAANPPTISRFRLWCRAGITVEGQPNWLFIKLHCHGMAPRDKWALLGDPMRVFLKELIESGDKGVGYRVKFVTAREMVNIILAACDGLGDDPGRYRDYRFRIE